MNRLWFLFLVLIFNSCSNTSYQDEVREWMTPNGKIKVLSSIGMIQDIVKQVGGDHIDTLTLIKGDLDPHSYQLVKGDDEKLAVANIIFYNGLGLEHGPSLQHYIHREKKAIPLGNRIEEQNSDLILRADGVTDPHIWMDVSLWAHTIPIIVAELGRIDPEHKDDYLATGKKVAEKMLEEHKKIKNMMHAVPDKKRYLVTSHDAFNYFCRAYLVPKGGDDGDKRCVAPEGLAPESQLSTIDIQEIIDHVAKYHVKVLFPESNVSKDSIRKIVSAGREKGLELRIADAVLYADAMGPQGSDGDTYLKMVHHNAKVISENLME